MLRDNADAIAGLKRSAKEQGENARDEIRGLRDAISDLKGKVEAAENDAHDQRDRRRRAEHALRTAERERDDAQTIAQELEGIVVDLREASKPELALKA